MTTYQSTLTIDFGEVGYRNSKQLFCVRLDAAPLTDLIRATEQAHRVYELLLIDRPGDVWDYVWVVVDEVFASITRRVSRARQESTGNKSDSPWPEDRLPFKVFDSLFCWAWDDTEPVQHLIANLTLDGDLDAALREASERAKSKRPMWV